MYLIVGLGNPGSEYAKTRHNMGFQTIDRLADKWGLTFNQENFKGTYVKTKFKGEDVILLKPLTYMNLSGESVSLIMNYFKIPVENVVIIYDDLDTIPGKIRLREKGSSGGQNGIKNIINILKTENIKRIRVGIGKNNISIIDYVLGRPSKEDEANIAIAQEHAVEAIEATIEKGFGYAQSRYC